VREDHVSAYPLALLTNPDLKNYRHISGVGPKTPVNIEEFIRLKPDLVIYWNIPQELQKFDAAGIPAVVINWSAAQPQNLEEAITDQKQKFEFLADILGGNAPRQYAMWSDYCDKTIAFIKSRTSKLNTMEYPVVYWGNSWGENILATWGAFSSNSFIIDLCGGRFVGVKGPGQFPEIGKEQLMAWAPDVIIVDNHGREPEKVIKDLQTNKDWENLPAVKQNRLYRIPSGVFFLDKGTSMPVYLLWLAQQLHPTLFTDVDTVKEMQYYFKTFYDYGLSENEARKALKGWVEQEAYRDN
jgi:iron complex transport system substrate-binding protein